ncbi:protein TBATA isoform X15 [Gorilla gorilla gorilla]|uniref:protein TBATA isoform X15 n=1 Tax=Gorilla gorilla gorilla TaxID=9595 RepID=UPI00300AEE60
MATDVQLAEYPLMSPRSLRGEWRMEQETQGPSQWSPQRVWGQHALLSTSRVHLYSKRTPFSQGHREKGMQTAISPKAELKLEKKSGCKPRSPRDSGPQKELVIPGIVDFEWIRRALRTPKPQTPGTYCFGRLSHHSFFSRHHPHPQHVTHVQASNPLQISPGSLSVSSGIFQPPCLSQLSFPAVKCGYPPSLSPLETHSLIGTPSFLLKEQKEEPLREQGAKYSAETGRLIPTSTRAVGRRRSHQGQQSQSSSRDEGVQAFLLQDQELLGGLTSPGIRFSGPVGRGTGQVLELLCQILETDSLSAIQFWLLYAPPKEKDLALGLLQTAVAQLLPQPLVSIPTEKLLNQLQEVREPPQEKQEPPCRVHWRSSSPPDAFKPEHREEEIEAEGRELRGPNTCTCLAQEQPQGFRGVSVSTTFTAVPDSLP